MTNISEEQKNLADMAKQVPKGRREIPASQAAYIEKVQIEEKTIETRHGDTKVFHVTNKEQKANAPLIITVHGGGFCRPHNNGDMAFSSMIAYRTGAVVLDVDYKLTPDYKFPVPYEEVYDVAKWASQHADELGIDKDNIVLCGNSSGGNLVAATALKANEMQEFKIKLQVINYAPVDLYTDPEDKPEAYKSYVPFEQARAYNGLYVSHEEAKDPHVSMVFATKEMMEGLPQALVISADNDSLHNELEKYAIMMMEAGVKVTMRKFLKSNHGFVVFCMGEEWEEAHQLIIDTINNATK